MVFPLALAALGTGLTASQVLGKDKDKREYSQNSSGYGSLPSYLQSLFQPYAQQVQNMAQNPNTYNPGNFNQEQQGAYQGLAHPDFGQESLANYLAPYAPLKDQLMQSLQQRGQESQNSILNQFGASNAGNKGGLNSSLAHLLSQNESNTNQQAGDLDASFLLQALGLRDNALQNQLQYGNAQYNLQEQQGPYAQLQRYIEALGAVPLNSSSGSTIGAQAGQQNTIGKIGQIVGGGISAGGGSSLFQ